MPTRKQFLDSANEEMCKWAYEYLRGRDFHLNVGARSHYEACMSFLNMLFPDSSKLLEKEMQAAWRQRKYIAKKKANGKKPGNFILNEASFEKLENLAKELGMPMSETLDKIIKQAHDAYQRKLKPKPKKAVKKIQPRKIFSRIQSAQNANDRVKNTIGIPKSIPDE